MTQEIKTFKAQARRLQKHLKVAYPSFGYSESLEAIAALHGVANWRTLQGTASSGIGMESLDEKFNIFEWQFNDGDPKKPIISTLLIQDEAGEQNNFYYQDIRHVEDEYLEQLREYFAALLSDSPVDTALVTELEDAQDDIAIDVGDEYYADGLTVGELMSMKQIGIDLWQLADGRKLKFMYNMAAQASAPLAKKQTQPIARKPKETVAFESEDITEELKDLLREFVLHYHQGGAISDTVEAAERLLGAFDESGKHRKELSTPRYVFGNWGHLFGVGMPEVNMRFVFDKEKNKLVQLHIYSQLKGWLPASAVQLADVEDSLKNANEEALSNPEDYGLEFGDELPDWAKA